MEDSRHASASYDKFDSRVEIVFLDTAFKFSPLENTEILFGFRQAYPVEYSRSTYDPAGNLKVVLDYELENFRDFTFQLRTRQGPFEPYVSVAQKSQDTGWNSCMYPAPPNYFAYILTHYEDFSLGLRYLSDNESLQEQESNFSLFKRPLLLPKQLTFDAQLRYRNGALRRNVYLPPVESVIDNYYQRLESQYTPGIRLGYGMGEDLEVTSGLAFSFPYKYRFIYRSAGVTLLNGIYTLEDEFNIPLELRYRPLKNAEILFTADMSYCQQKLDYWKRAGGVVTDYDTKKLEYFNARPSVTLAYLHEANKSIVQDKFSRLTKALLSQGQFLLEFKYLRDISDLDKNAANGPQNKIDPSGVFLYPTDLFMAGTEYSTFYTGNKSDTAANVVEQDYNLFQLAFTYGLSDRFNAGVLVGHHGSSRFHHFTLGRSTSPYDLTSRYYVIKPYWSFSIPFDWRWGEKSLLSFLWYYVPEYRTDIDIAGLPKKFCSKTAYYSLSLALKVLF